tara:strand:- start:348 stop:566 length:219 start_codon:yes stop_codon:yes gene_type:complete
MEVFDLGGYGQFVWPSFIFSFASCFLVYLKTKKDLLNQEKIFSKEFNQIPSMKFEVARKLNSRKKVSSGNII